MIKTARLILRPWKEEDLDPFAAINADPRVMEYFPAVMSREESDRFANAIMEHFKNRGWGLWAASLENEIPFIGFIGLRYIDFEAAFTPAVEVGWRLAYEFWNKGYATEGAQAALKYGFERLKLTEIVAFTAEQNMRSRAVMEKLRMHHDPHDDFNNPKLPAGHRLSRHVLYRIKSEKWKTALSSEL